MNTEIVCPDCGKIIAPPDANVEPTARCRCAERAESSPAAEEKRCYVCGRELTGRARLKDNLGRYWCKDCAKADKQSRRGPKQAQCPDCHRMFPPNKLEVYDNIKLCPTCLQARKKSLQKQIRKVGIKDVHHRYEVGPLQWMAWALLLLSAIALAQWLFFHRS